MPNWCSNSATVSHKDPKQIARLVKAFQGNGLMQEFYPCPQDLLDTVAGALAITDPGYEAFLKQQADNKAKYGHTDWYDWKVANWGTKWDVSSKYPEQCRVSPCGKSVELSFDSAWSPPIGFYEHLHDEFGFNIKAYYHEGGVNFCGRWHNGNDDFYDISGGSDWVHKHIPRDIDDAMAISESMAEWEEEAEEHEAPHE